jgi:hypothetical protein
MMIKNFYVAVYVFIENGREMLIYLPIVHHGTVLDEFGHESDYLEQYDGRDVSFVGVYPFGYDVSPDAVARAVELLNKRK